MDLFLFLITIFCLPLIIAAQPFIDCSGKSFLCENSTHFTICVDVGGGVSMTVGNIVLSCPPTTFCDENNAFECEYRTSTSTSTTPSPISQDTNIPTETTEARLTTNVYDEFLFTSDSQQAEANVIFPTQQKYIIPGNANVIFDDTDNAVLVYGNIDSEIVNSTPVNEKVPRNLNATNSANINDYKNRTIDVNKKFIRRNKELTPKFEEARRELSTTIAQTTDTTDNIMTTPSDSVTIEESSTVEFLTATTNIEISVTPSTIPDIGRNLSHITNYTSRSNNQSKSTIKNKNLDLTANFTVNNLLDTELGLKVIERAPFNATKSDLTHLIAVSNPNISVNHSHTDVIKDKAKEMLQLNRNNRTTTNLLKDNKDTIIQSKTVPFTGSADVTDLNIPTERYPEKATHSKNIPNSSAHLIDTISTTPDQSIKLKLIIPTERYVQNEKSSKDILSNSTRDFKTISTTPSWTMEKSAQNAINSSAHLIKTISTTPDDSVLLNMNIATESYDENHKFSKDATQSNSTGHFTETITTTPSTITERYSPNSTISKYRLANTSLHLHAEIPTKANESVKSNVNTTVKRYGQNANHSTDSIPLNSGHQIKSTSTVPNKPIKSNLSTPTMRYAQNATFLTDFSKSSKNPIETISTIPVEVVRSILNTPTESFAPNDMFSRGIILPDSLDFNSVGNSLKTSTLRNEKLRDIEKKILFEDLVHPTTVKNVTPHLRTTTKTYILNGIMSNPIIPSESSEVDITFGDILKVNKDSTNLKIPKQLDLTEKAILNPTIKPDNQENSKVSSHDDTLRTKLSDYINSFNLDLGNNKGNDTITKKNFHMRNKTISVTNKPDKINTDAINTTEIITDKIMLGLEYLNGTLYSNVETITEFTTENIVTLQQTNSYQTTSRSNGLENIKNALFEDTDYSVLLFPASTVETLVTELSTTPQTYIQNSLISNPIIPNDSPDFDISFGDLIKGNKDFIELKSPLQISFTDRPISDFNGRSENRESLRNFRSTSHNNSLNNDLAANSSDNITKADFDIFNSTETKNVSVANVTVIDESYVKNAAVIVENETLNKDLTPNLTSLFPNTKIALNTANGVSPQYNLHDHELNITTKDIENKNYTIVENETLNKDLVSKLTSFFENTKNALNTAKGASLGYNLTDHELNIATQDIENKNYTNKTMENTTYLPLDKKRIINKIPMSNMLLKNATEVNHLNPNENDIKGKEILDTATSVINDILKENKMRKVTDTELLNNTKSELTYSNQSSLETSHYFTYTGSTTINYNKNENKIINSQKDNTTELFERVMLENKTGILTSSNNGETLKNNRDMSISEDMTESILNISNTYVDLTNSVIYTEVTVTNSFNSKDLAKEGAYFTEEPMPSSSTLLDEMTENQPAILFNGNTKDTFTSYKEINGIIQKADEITSPKYDLSNHTQNITTVSIAEKGHTKANETNNNATYLTVNEKKMEKPISNAILQNVTVENSKTLNDEDFEIAPISDAATFTMDDKRKDNKIIKLTDNDLLNGSLVILNYSTQSTLEASEYLTNTEGITVSYDQNNTIDPLKNNTADLIQSETRNNREIANNNSVASTVKVVTDTVLNISNSTHIDLVKNFIDTAAPISNSVIGNDQTEKIPTVQYMTTGPVLNLSKPILDTLVENKTITEKNIAHVNKNGLDNTENSTEHTLLKPTTIGSESILNDTFVDVIKKDQRALPISSSINSVGQETDFIDSPMVSTHNNKTPIANSSLTIENMQNRLEKELLEDNRKEDVTEFVFNSLENVTQPILNKPTLKKNTTIVKKANDGLVTDNGTNNNNQYYNTKYTISDYSTPMFTMPLSTMTTEHVYLTTESGENGQTTFRSLTPNNATSVTDTSIYDTDIKKISNKRNDQNTLYDGFVNSINNDINPSIQVSTSTVRYEDQTSLRLENEKENSTQDIRQVNYNVTILLSETINATTAATTTTFALKPQNPTLIVFNKMNTSKVLNDHGLNDMLLTNKSVMNVATVNKNNARVNKLEQNLNSKNNYSVSYDKFGRGKLQLKVHNFTTKSIEKNSKIHENIKVDNVREQSQHSKTNTTIFKDSKNESIIQKCSNRSICISQGNGQVSIELYNKTRINVSIRNNSNSKSRETRVRDNDHVLITTVNNANKTEHGTVNKIVMQTERHDSATPLVPTYLNIKKETNEKPIKHIETTKSSLILQNTTLQLTSSLPFDCKNHSRGRYADKDNCRKFYICIGYSIPIMGYCPENTVFSEFKKQCTNNLSHCIRNNQFKCVKDGRFIDVWQDNMYYVCVRGPNHRFLRLKLECKSGYVLDKVNVMCKQGKKVLKTSSSISSNSSSSSSLSSSNKKKNKSNKNPNKKSSNDTGFKCKEEGKFVDPNNCRKYYICSKTSKSVLRRKRKKCDSDEVFDDDKKECVDEDSYECL